MTGRMRTYVMIVMAAAVFMAILQPAWTEAGDRESVQWYNYYEHRTMLETLDTAYIYGSAICTLAIWNLSELISSGLVVDSTKEEHWVGANTFTLSLMLALFGAGDTARIDSLWFTEYSESGLGPLVNADTSSVIIGPNITNDGFYGPHPALSSVTQGRNYPLRITRGRTWMYLMGKATLADTAAVYLELAKMRR